MCREKQKKQSVKYRLKCQEKLDKTEVFGRPGGGDGALIKGAILITAAVLVGTIMFWTVKKVEMTKTNMLYMVFLLTYSAILFLPTMHERYGYIYEILSILVALKCKKTWAPALALQLIAIRTYGKFLFVSDGNIILLSWINVLVFVIFSYILNQEMIKNDV